VYGSAPRQARPRISSDYECWLFDLFSDHGETRERMRAEARDHRYIRGVAPPRDQNAADPRPIVSRVEGKPSVAEKGFEPGVESIGAGSRGTPMSPR